MFLSRFSGSRTFIIYDIISRINITRNRKVNLRIGKGSSGAGLYHNLFPGFYSRLFKIFISMNFREYNFFVLLFSLRYILLASLKSISGETNPKATSAIIFKLGQVFRI